MKSPNEFKEAFAKAEALMKEHQVPVVIEFILERVTNIAMGTEIDKVNEFEEILCLDPELKAENQWIPAARAGKAARRRCPPDRQRQRSAHDPLPAPRPRASSPAATRSSPACRGSCRRRR